MWSAGGVRSSQRKTGGSVCDLVHAGRDLPQQSRRALGRWVLAYESGVQPWPPGVTILRAGTADLVAWRTDA